MDQETDTIAAIATPMGDGGVAIIRISGQEAIRVASRCFSRPLDHVRSHQAVYGTFGDVTQGGVDHGLALVMRAPRTFTGENVVEFHCHGGRMITREVLELVLRAGARMASPGEFSKRAFLHGKIDMAQAEAIQQLIGAKNRQALEQARRQLRGKLSETVKNIQQRLYDVAAILEAHVDFPEEGLEFATEEEVKIELSDVIKEMERLVQSFSHGKRLQVGLEVCLAGAPNVGKSSLMNALLGQDRVIVTPIAGTTRDFIQESVDFGQIHAQIQDTAGIRETQDPIEKMGIARAFVAIEEADVTLWVMDTTAAFDPAWLEKIDLERTIFVWNKADLAKPPREFVHQVVISCKTGEGLDALRDKIACWGQRSLDKDEVVLTQERHRDAMRVSLVSLQKVCEGLTTGLSPEFLTLDLRQSLRQLQKILGGDLQEEILSSIFAKFCVGK